MSGKREKKNGKQRKRWNERRQTCASEWIRVSLIESANVHRHFSRVQLSSGMRIACFSFLLVFRKRNNIVRQSWFETMHRNECKQFFDWRRLLKLFNCCNSIFLLSGKANGWRWADMGFSVVAGAVVVSMSSETRNICTRCNQPHTRTMKMEHGNDYRHAWRW